MVSPPGRAPPTQRAAAAASTAAAAKPPGVVPTAGLVVSLLSASLVMMSAGTAYLFSLYGTQLSTALGLTQSQTAFIAMCGSSGIYISGPLFGGLVDRHRTMSAAFFLGGGGAIFVGYALVASAYVGDIPQPHFLVLALIYLCIGIGSAACYHCSLATNYRNWPVQHRGAAVGVTVAFFGLSAFFFTQLGSWLFQATDEDGVRSLDIGGFLWFLGASCFAFNAVAAFTLRDMTQPAAPAGTPSLDQIQIEPDESNGQDADHLARDATETSPLLPAHQGTSAASTLRSPRRHRSPSRVSSLESSSSSNALPHLSPHQLVDGYDHEDLATGTAGELIRGADQQPSVDVVEEARAMRDFEIQNISCFYFSDAYLLAYTVFTIVGAGLMYIGNVGAIILSLSPPDQDSSDPAVQSAQKTHVILLSLLGFSSRIIIGLISDVCFRHLSIPRVAWASVGAILSALASGLMCMTTTLDQLIVASVLFGMAYGAVWTITPVLVGEFFGYQNFGSNWGWMTVVPAFGGQFFSFLFGWVYDSTVTVAQTVGMPFASGSAEHRVCRGPECFRGSFAVAFWLSVSCIVVSMLLYWRRAVRSA